MNLSKLVYIYNIFVEVSSFLVSLSEHASLVYVTSWRWTVDKPLSKLMMTPINYVYIYLLQCVWSVLVCGRVNVTLYKTEPILKPRVVTIPAGPSSAVPGIVACHPRCRQRRQCRLHANSRFWVKINFRTNFHTSYRYILQIFLYRILQAASYD